MLTLNIELIDRHRWVPHLLIVLLALLLYMRSIPFGYVDYDDTFLIRDNQSFLKDPANIPLAFTRDVFAVRHYRSSRAFYRPIMTISLMTDAIIGGANISVYRVSNLLLHVFCTIVLFHLMVRLGIKREFALAGSLIFLVHPVNVQAVAWVPGRNDTILALLSMLSVLFLIRFKEDTRVYIYVLHILSFLLALFTKETAVFLIFLFIMVLLLSPRINKGEMITLIAGWMGSILIWSIMRHIALTHTPADIHSILKSIIINLPGMIQYTGKALLPVHLSVYPLRADIPLIYGVCSGIALSLLVVFSIKRARREILLMSLIWYVLLLMPAIISHSPGAQTLLLEHRLYLPLAGLIIGVTEALSSFVIWRRGLVGGFFIVIVLFSVVTYQRTTVYRDSFTFWRDAVETSPHSPMAHINLGDQYLRHRDLDNAEKEALTALRLDPQTTLAHNNLGIVYAIRGRLKDAEREFQEELRINPGYDDALYNLGMLYYQQNDIEKAMHYWQEVLSINPYHIKTNRILALFYYKFGDKRRARVHAERLRSQGVNVPIPY